jgi:Phage tail tube protein, TTP
MPTFLKGRNVRVEVATAYAAADVVTAITLAATPVVTSASHGQVNGTIGFFSGVVGMDEIDGQAYRVTSSLASTFELQGYSTVGFGAFTSGNAIAVSTWATLAQSTSYTIGGGDATTQNKTTLLDIMNQQENGMLAAQTVSFDGFVVAGGSPAMTVIRDAAFSGGYIVFRITHPNGDARVFRGQTSLPGESVSVDQMATAGFSCNVQGRVLFL